MEWRLTTHSPRATSIFPANTHFILKNVISSSLLWLCWSGGGGGKVVFGSQSATGWLFLNDEAHIPQRSSRVSCLYANELCVKHGCCEGGSLWKSWLHGSVNQRAFPNGSSILLQSATHKLYTHFVHTIQTLNTHYTHTTQTVHMQTVCMTHAVFTYIILWGLCSFDGHSL